VRPSIGDAQAKLVLRCLERDPAKRVQTARELRESLEAVLEEAGIVEPLATLARFVKAPAEEGPKVRAQIVESCLRRGEADLRSGKTTAALADFGRVLALDPRNEAARTLVDRVRRRTRLLNLARRAAIGVGVAGVLALVAVPALRFAQRTRDHWMAQPTPPAVAAPAPSPALPKETAPAALEPPDSEKSSAGSPAPSQKDTRSQGEGTERPLRSSARPPSRKSSPPKVVAVAPPPPAAEIKPEVKEVPATLTIGSRLPARLFVDDKDQGSAMVFRLQLAPGPHDFVVQHQCCQENRGVIQVAANKELYPLDVGSPKPGHLRVTNAADPDTPVYLVEEETGNLMPLGTARDVARFDIPMRKPTEERRFVIGERERTKTLEAGRVVTIDAQDGR
jgi:hypothetical protein